MIPMRQRVLLVAGWVLAAAVISLVASGAVAVAGGQVNDRPLSGVLAANVAALPVVDTEDLPVCEPPASGGSNCTTEAPPAGAQNERPGSSDGLDPAGGEIDVDELPQFDPDPTGFPEPVEDGQIPKPEGPTSRVVSAAGGIIGVTVIDDHIRVWVIPHFGYRYEYDATQDGTTVRITFTRGDEQNSTVVRWRDGELSWETSLGE